MKKLFWRMILFAVGLSGIAHTMEKITYEVMPLEVLKKIVQMKTPQELEDVRPPTKANKPLLFSFGAARSYGPNIWGSVDVSDDGSVAWYSGGCRYLNVYPPETPISPENRNRPFMGQCLLSTSLNIGWEKVRRLAQAILNSGFPALPLLSEPFNEGVPATKLPTRNRLIFTLGLAETFTFQERIAWTYAIECSPGDPKCEAVWQVLEEEFWLPLKSRYPWLPEKGSPVYHPTGGMTSETSEGKHYEETSPLVICHIYPGTFRPRECEPDYHWTDEDEKKLMSLLAKRKSQETLNKENKR